MVNRLLPNMRLVSNHDGTYDLWLDYSRGDTEFAKDFDFRHNLKKNSRKLLESVRAYTKNTRIRSVKILVSGVLVATIAFSSFLTSFAATDRYTMGYLYSGTDHQQIEYVNQANNSLDVVSPSYFDIREDGSLKLNYLSAFFIKTMHDQGIRVVPFLSNHWNRTAGINALADVEALSTQVANYVEEYDLDGVNVDIENVTHEQRDQYTERVRLLREKIPEHKEVSVAVAANPKNWQTGWHGSYDYAALAKYADHLLIMAYDEHHEGGEAGPVASIDFVENSIRYALERTTPDKIVIGIPFYGRVWSLDDDRIIGKGVSNQTIVRILNDCESTVTYDEESQSVKAEFTVTAENGRYTVGGDFVLLPGNYVVWFDNAQSYEAKLSLIETYNLKGAGAWSLGQEDTSIWDYYEDWINGSKIPESPSVTPPAEEPSDSGESGGSAEETPDTPDSSEPPQESPNTPDLPEPPQESPVTPETPQTPGSQEYFEYSVKRGDTLWKIAQRYLGKGSRYSEIIELNHLTSDRIYPGMALKIPGSSSETSPAPSYRTYTVKRGDSLWKIAQSQLGLGSRYPEIMELNGLTGDSIYPGQILKLPD